MSVMAIVMPAFMAYLKPIALISSRKLIVASLPCVSYTSEMTSEICFFFIVLQQILVRVLQALRQDLVLDQPADGGAVLQRRRLDRLAARPAEPASCRHRTDATCRPASPADDARDALRAFEHVGAVRQADGDRLVDVELAHVVGQHRLFRAGEDLVARLLVRLQLADHRQVVVAENDVLHRRDDRAAVRGLNRLCEASIRMRASACA